MFKKKIDRTGNETKEKPNSPPKAAEKNKAKEKKNSKTKSKVLKVPRSVQETIPYYRVYKNGIIETEPGKFSKTYPLEDVNFSIANQQDQENIFCAYGDLLNTWGADVKIQITINNRNIDQEQFAEKTLLRMKKDNLNEYREEYNEMLLQKMSEGRNNMRKEKYVTLTIEEQDIEAAINTFSRLDGELSARIKKINNFETVPMTTLERLSVLHDIYNIGEESTFYRKAQIDGKDVKSYDFDAMVKMGLTTKDLIGPDGFEFAPSYFKSGNNYGRVLFLDNLPTLLSTDILNDITNVSCNMVLSVHFQPLRQDKALSLIKNQMTNINSNVVDAQKRATKSGYSPDLISPDLIRAQNEAARLLHDMTKKNQKMFLVTIIVTHFANNLEELNKDTELIKSNVSKHLCQLKVLRYQQEAGLTTALPLGMNKVEVKRLLTTESSAVFIPFSAQELSQDGGMYYGLNAVSRNMLLFNRLSSKNASGVILGTPGSGKSFAAKREMTNVLLNTDDDVFIIDPERGAKRRDIRAA